MVCACLPATAHATQSASLHAAFTPERLGQGTALTLSVQTSAPAGGVPSPLTALDLGYPSDLGVTVGGLGLATCSPTAIEAFGAKGCSAESRMGYGSALAEIPIGPEIVEETARVTIVRAPIQEGHLALLFYLEALTPVAAYIVFPGLLLPGPATNDETVHFNVPVVPSLPGAPNVSVVQLTATIGPRGLTYYEHVRGKIIAYHPKGVLLPNHCPRGGFRFTASLAFEDGSHTSVSTTVHCPGRRQEKGRTASAGSSVPADDLTG